MTSQEAVDHRLGGSRLYKVHEVAADIPTTKTSVYQLIASGRLDVVRFGPKGGVIRVTEESLAAFKDGHR